MLFKPKLFEALNHSFESIEPIDPRSKHRKLVEPANLVKSGKKK